MLTVNRFHHIFRYSVLSFILVSSSDSLATDWYWTIPYGGTWDEGAYTWEDENGVNPPSGKPAAGDNAFLVVPYEWGDFLTVRYRSTDNPLLENIVIEGRKVLSQRYTPGFSIPLNLNLTSNYEYIGGSPYTYNLPPSVVLPPIGILPEGVHEQDAGFNRVNNLLQIGGTEGSTGRYLLESYSDHVYGTLEVGQMEVIGAAGNGEFEQNGGYHLLDPGSSLIFGQSSTGTGSYNMISGWLEADIEILGAAGYGEFTQTSGWHEANQFTIGEQAGGRGEYTLDGGTLSVETETIGDGGRGNFIQNAGEHYANSMVVGAQNLGYTSRYELNGGTLSVGTETIGDGGSGYFSQYGGEHLADTLVIGVQDSVSLAGFNLNGGTLDVAQTTTVGVLGDVGFTQSAGTNFTTGNLKIADGSSSQSAYTMNGGSLHAEGSLILGQSGEGTFYHNNGDVKIGPDGGTTGALSVMGSDDSYQMNGGTLTVNGSENISGTFRQIGGNHTISATTLTQQLTNALDVGAFSNSGSYYIGADGSLSSPNINIGTGADDDGGFHQNNELSTVTTTYLNIGVQSIFDSRLGEYKLSAGSLNIGDDVQPGTLSLGLIATDGGYGQGLLILDGGELSVKGEMIIGDGGLGDLDILSGQHNVTGSVQLGNSEYLNTITQQGGSFDVTGDVSIGINGFGSYRHRSGDNTYTGDLIVDNPVYDNIASSYLLGEAGYDTLPDPDLTVNGMVKIGVSAAAPLSKESAFIHHHGTHTINGELQLGSEPNASGLYQQMGGYLVINGNETVGYRGDGNYNQSGGNHIVSETIYLGGGDALNVYGGSGTGSYILSGDGVLNADTLWLGYGNGAQGTYTQTGGTATFNTLRAAGYNANTPGGNANITLNSGNLIVNGEEAIGYYFGTATFNHTGGSNTAGTFNLGTYKNADATYNLTGTGELHVTGSMDINDVGGYDWPDQWGHGGFIQNGDDTLVDIGGILTINPSSSDVGYGYKLSRGTLNNGGVELNGLAARYGEYEWSPWRDPWYISEFLQEGGEHNINGDLTIRAGGADDVGSGTIYVRAYGQGGRYYLNGGILRVNELHIEGDTQAWAQNEGRLKIRSDSDATIIHVAEHTLLNEGLTTFEGGGAGSIVNGRVENRGEMTVTDTAVDFNGTFINSGEFYSESSDVQFDQLTVEATGYMTGNSEDVLSVSGDFMNGSLENTLWDTDVASLIFNGTGVQNFYLAGDDLGVDGLGYQDNFAWGELIINSGVELTIFDGNIFEGAGLYVGALGLEDGVDTGSLLIDYILSDFNIYYDQTLAENSYLQGLTFALNGEGFLMPSAVPVPSAVWLFGSGLLGLVAIARRKKATV